MTIWKEVSGFPNYYVSDDGRVFSKSRKRLLKPHKKHHSWQLCLSNRGVRRYAFVHTLVAEAFLNPPKEGQNQINHKDEDTSNNNANNLEWCTAKYNTNYGTLKKRQSILKTIGSPEVVALSLDKKVLKFYEYHSEAVADGFHKAHIGACKRGIRKSHKGFTWYTLEDYIGGII